MGKISAYDDFLLREAERYNEEPAEEKELENLKEELEHYKDWLNKQLEENAKLKELVEKYKKLYNQLCEKYDALLKVLPNEIEEGEIEDDR